MVILAMLMSQGNGIAASNAVKDGNLSVDLKTSSPGFVDKFSQKQGRKFKAAYTFPKANQEIWIRYWLAAPVASIPTRRWNCSRCRHRKPCRV
jgi:bicarbonate transport system substrate-binding protein